MEAARLVVQLPETTIDNFHERAYRMELYLTGDAELPEQDNMFNDLMEVIQEAKSSVKDLHKEHPYTPILEPVENAGGIGRCTGIGDAGLLEKEREKFFRSASGIPSTEGEAMLLRGD